MELGGNARAKEYYTKNNMMDNGKPDHKNPQLGKYKMQLKTEAAKECGVELPKEQEVKKEEVKKEEVEEKPKEEVTK